jgi:hypothetical protein
MSTFKVPHRVGDVGNIGVSELATSGNHTNRKSHKAMLVLKQEGVDLVDSLSDFRCTRTKDPLRHFRASIKSLRRAQDAGASTSTSDTRNS